MKLKTSGLQSKLPDDRENRQPRTEKKNILVVSSIGTSRLISRILKKLWKLKNYKNNCIKKCSMKLESSRRKN